MARRIWASGPKCVSVCVFVQSSWYPMRHNILPASSILSARAVLPPCESAVSFSLPVVVSFQHFDNDTRHAETLKNNTPIILLNKAEPTLQHKNTLRSRSSNLLHVLLCMAVFCFSLVRMQNSRWISTNKLSRSTVQCSIRASGFCSYTSQRFLTSARTEIRWKTSVKWVCLFFKQLKDEGMWFRRGSTASKAHSSSRSSSGFNFYLSQWAHNY